MNRSNIANASSEEIKDVFVGLKKQFFPNERWIGKHNAYSNDCTKKLDKYLSHGPASPVQHNNHTLNDKHLREYIASSSPLHCADGWSFLGRAFDALLHGDTGAATHLGYYAELRASMCLLATQGIGVFSSKHFIVAQGGSCLPLNKVHPTRGTASTLGTHKVIWPLLQDWMSLPSATKLIGDVISPNDKSLNDWLDAFSPIGSQSIKSKWLREWGVDLKRFTKDHDARNFSSYRPGGINSKAITCSRKDFDFIKSFWALFEPSPSSSFESIDKFLMREAIGLSYYGSTNREPSKDDGIYVAKVNKMLKDTLAFGNPLVLKQWERFVLKEANPDTPKLIEYASKCEKITDPEYHLHVLARASILLRLATGAASQLFTSNSINKADVEFWWKPFGESRGLWDPSSPPADFNDLWVDIEDTIEMMDGYSANDWLPLEKWHSLIKTPLFASSCERIALWGLRI